MGWRWLFSLLGLYDCYQSCLPLLMWLPLEGGPCWEESVWEPRGQVTQVIRSKAGTECYGCASGVFYGVSLSHIELPLFSPPSIFRAFLFFPKSPALPWCVPSRRTALVLSMFSLQRCVRLTLLQDLFVHLSGDPGIPQSFPRTPYFGQESELTQQPMTTTECQYRSMCCRT